MSFDSPSCPDMAKYPLIGALILLAACETSVPPETMTDPGPIAPQMATCEAPVGGPFALPVATSLEATPGYDEALAAQDLETLPPELDLQAAGAIERALIGYMLQIPVELLPPRVSLQELLDHGPMGLAIAGAFAEGERQGMARPDLGFLRRGLHRFYLCDRRFPLTLQGFQQAFADFSQLPSVTIDSIPKQGARRLRGDPTLGIWVGESLDSNDEVRETEIILSGGRDDGALDFLAYDGSGVLMDRSRFTLQDGGDISGAAPYTCLMCHMNPTTQRFDRVHP